MEYATLPIRPIPTFDNLVAFDTFRLSNTEFPITFKLSKFPNCWRLELVIPTPISLPLNIVVPFNLYCVEFTIPFTSNKY